MTFSIHSHLILMDMTPTLQMWKLHIGAKCPVQDHTTVKNQATDRSLQLSVFKTGFLTLSKIKPGVDISLLWGTVLCSPLDASTTLFCCEKHDRYYLHRFTNVCLGIKSPLVDYHWFKVSSPDSELGLNLLWKWIQEAVKILTLINHEVHIKRCRKWSHIYTWGKQP